MSHPKGSVHLVHTALRAAQAVQVSSERAGAALLLNRHGAVVDVLGGDRAAAGRRDGAGSPQAVGAVSVGAETAAQGAACEAVLAVPGVGPAAGIRERVAVGVTGHSGRTSAIEGSGSQAVGGIVGVSIRRGRAAGGVAFGQAVAQGSKP